MFRNLFIVSVVALLFVPFPAGAQSSLLRGTVTDAQNALIPGVVVTVTNVDTAIMRSTVSDDMGAYAFTQVPPGVYKVQGALPGFNTFTAQVRLQIDTPAVLNIKMEVGTVAESLNVFGDVAAVNTENATIGNPFTQTQVRQLPLQTRNVVELLSLQPGVTPTGEVIGARKDQNNVTLDGVDVNDNQSGIGVLPDSATDDDRRRAAGFQAALPIPLDSVQEFRTTVAGQGADQGRSSGGQVSLVTKSGSNEFHGSVYEYLRNKLTAANNWFNNRAGIAREPLIRNQYGASFGGRIVKNRVFFFANWEDRKDRSAITQSRIVPSELMKQGIIQYRLSDGTIGRATQSGIQAIDPLHIGVSPTLLNIMKQYPVGNDPAGGSDRGLNFSAFRFNAPQTRNDRAYVTKLDFNLDPAGKHTLMLRGTLADNHQDLTVAEFPGMGPASVAIDRSKGVAGRYTYVMSANKINVFSFGYTRLGVEQSGNTAGASLNWGVLSNLTDTNPATRPSARTIPTTNFVDDMTWIKGRHTFGFGTNLRFMENDRTSYGNSFASYSFSRNTLKGLGADITAAVNTFVQQQSGNASLKITEATPVTNAFGALLGVVNQYSATYNYDHGGNAIAFGQPTVRAFVTKESEFYLQDTWKARRDLTLTYGLRYSLNGVPYEKNGLEVVTTVPLQNFLAERIYAQANGIPGYAMPDARLTYTLGGPKNNGPGWFERDNKMFAPRFNFAYAPTGDGLVTKVFGNGSVIRGGGSILYDRYGSDMVVNFDKSGSPGLSTSVSQPLNTDFTDGFRYTGASVPALPAAPQGGFPFTPPAIIGGFGSTTGVASNLRAPYSILLNMSVTRPVSKGMTVEVGYVGRLGRKGLLQQDFMQMLTRFKDVKSGTDWSQAMGVLRNYYENGITPAQVKANPSIIPTIPYIENIFPRAANAFIPGSATANYFFTTYGTYAASDLDALNEMDRIRRPDGTCLSLYGCNTFFALQNAGLRAWVNASNSAFHGGQLVLRRAVNNGWGFDFNYTLSHAIDIQSAAEGGAGASGAVIQDTFSPKSSRASSDFDIRHNISANTVLELPFGAGKPILRSASGWLNQIVGGWQLSSLAKYRSGLPYSIQNGGVYPTNYLNQAIAVLRPGTAMPANGTGYDQTGAPSLFRNTNAYESFMGQYPGTVGTRNIVRGPGFKTVDLSVTKSFQVRERQRIQFRAEAFNAFNNVNFDNPTTTQLSLSSPSTFGQITSAQPARVMQFALRYEF
jgi:hypothetical protein